jgi:solute carrier family 35, member C2
MSINDQIEMTDVNSAPDSGSESSSGSGSEMDEESGLTKRERRQRNRQHDQLNVQIGEHIPVSKHEARLADRDVVKKLLINSVLILLWYLFSLSISIVSIAAHCKARRQAAHKLYSTINGCSIRDISTFTSPCTQPLST